ncbi:MAG: hypothetical protein K2X44_09085, partial [Magnetospirillum sp.]|nr:hypothetical protein [Magnetospirillum sp.]
MDANRTIHLLCMGLVALFAQPLWAQLPPPRPGFGNHEPPRHALSECRGRMPGDKLWHRTPEGEVAATCAETPWGLAARPDRPLRDYQPPPHALSECRGKTAGQQVLHRKPEGDVAATCRETPWGLAARPNRTGEGEGAVWADNGAVPKVQPYAAPGEPPTVSVSSIPVTSAQTIDVSGKVSSKGRVTALLVDGTETPLQPDGRFAVRRGIPLGDSE